MKKLKNIIAVVVVTATVFSFGVIKSTNVVKVADAEISFETASVQDPGGGVRP